jgi:hypothetical protein
MSVYGSIMCRFFMPKYDGCLISFGINDVLFFYGCSHINYDDPIDRFMLSLYYVRSTRFHLYFD